MKRIVFVAVAGWLAVFLTGCAVVYYPDPMEDLVNRGQGIYHTAKSGETLWAIAQAYQADIDQIILLNNITDSAVIRKGQKIFIPGSHRVVQTDVKRTAVARPEAQRAAPVRQDFRKDEFAWPFKGEVVSFFLGRDAGFWDHGMRIRLDSGSQVSATRQGKVVFLDDLTGYGPTVILDHMDGFMSVYAGGVQPVVRLGDTVYKGDAVAVSPTGVRGFLYFEIRWNGAAVNPLFYLPKS